MIFLTNQRISFQQTPPLFSGARIWESLRIWYGVKMIWFRNAPQARKNCAKTAFSEGELIKNQENLNNEKHKSSYLNYNSICTFANKNKSLNLGMKTKLTSLIILLFIVVSCNTDCTVNKDISNIPMDVEVVRFDKAFAEATTDDLPQLKTAITELFSARVPDSIWVNKINDTLQNELERVPAVLSQQAQYSKPRRPSRSKYVVGCKPIKTGFRPCEPVSSAKLIETKRPKGC